MIFVRVCVNVSMSNALNNWKLKTFKIIDERVLFYSNNLDLLPPKPKLSFRYLKQGIQEFHRKYVLAPADKAANNVVVVCVSFCCVFFSPFSIAITSLGEERANLSAFRTFVRFVLV